MKPARLISFFLAAVLHLYCVASVHGATASAIPPSSPGDEVTAISGRVTDALTGAPVAGVGAHAGYWYDHWRGGYWKWISATTDQQGEYTIAGLWEGIWPVYFSDPRGIYLTTSPTDVPVSADQTVMGIDARLNLAGRIAGRVTNMVDRAPIARIIVDLYRAGDNTYLKYVYTDAGGNYSIGDLAAGKYVLRFWYNGDYYLPEYYDDVQQLDEAMPIAVIQGLTTTINVQLMPQGGIAGRVTDALNNPLPGIHIWARCAGGGELCDREAFTDAQGRYAVGFLNKDLRYRVIFSDPGGRFAAVFYGGTPFWAPATAVSVQPGVYHGGIDAVMQVGGEIRGRLTDAATDGPLASFVGGSGGFVALSGWDGLKWQGLDPVRANADGSYQFKTLYPGRYRVRFSGGDQSYAAEYYPGVPDEADAADIEVAPGQVVTGIDGALYAARITGRVTAEATGEPLGNIGVYLSGYRCGWMEWADRVTRTAPDGTYAFPRVWPGDCTVYFQDPEWDYEAEYYGDTPDKDQATELTVIPGALFTGIDAALTLRGRITGRVTATTGEPLSGVRVRPIYRNYAGPARETFTDADGGYMVRGLGVGAYRLLFTDPAKQYASRYYGPAIRQSTATWVTVTLASVVPEIDVQLPLGGRMAGQITDRWSGAPIAKAALNLYRQPFENSDVDYFSASSDLQGHYALSGLWGGAYQLCVYASYHQEACFALTVVEDEVLVLDVALRPSRTPPGFQLWLPLMSGRGAEAPPSTTQN